MIEDSVWERFDEFRQLQLRQALALVSESGILKLQAEAEFARLGMGDPAASSEEITKEVMRVRADTRGFLTIHEYGLQLAQEQEKYDA